MIDANGGRRTRLARVAPGDGAVSGPKWSPDGSTILYVTRPGILWMIDPDGRHRVAVLKRQQSFDVGWDTG